MVTGIPQNTGKITTLPLQPLLQSPLSLLTWEAKSQKRALAASCCLIQPWQYLLGALRSLPEGVGSLHTWRGWHHIPTPRSRGEGSQGKKGEQKPRRADPNCSRKLLQGISQKLSCRGLIRAHGKGWMLVACCPSARRVLDKRPCCNTITAAPLAPGLWCPSCSPSMFDLPCPEMVQKQIFRGIV